jgi:hypothetical protein
MTASGVRRDKAGFSSGGALEPPAGRSPVPQRRHSVKLPHWLFLHLAAGVAAAFSSILFSGHSAWSQAARTIKVVIAVPSGSAAYTLASQFAVLFRLQDHSASGLRVTVILVVIHWLIVAYTGRPIGIIPWSAPTGNPPKGSKEMDHDRSREDREVHLHWTTRSSYRWICFVSCQRRLQCMLSKGEA